MTYVAPTYSPLRDLCVGHAPTYAPIGDLHACVCLRRAWGWGVGMECGRRCQAIPLV